MFNDWISTEFLLTNWRAGSAQAERLCSAILRLDGFEDIEPQAPLGGPDGRKDILCSKGGLKYIGAVYFPVSQKTFPSIKKKFLNDLKGPAQNRGVGIVFLTNQTLTVRQRSILVECALDEDTECHVYNVERLKSILDAPTGYGVRLEFLKIPMNPDEQFAFFVHSGNTVEDAIERNTRELDLLGSRIDHVLAGQKYANQTLKKLATSSGFDSGAPPSRLDLQTSGNFTAEPKVAYLSSNLSPELVVAFHRLYCYDLPPRIVGRLRQQEAWIGIAGEARTENMRELPPHEGIPEQLGDLCLSWNEKYPLLRGSNSLDKLNVIAEFHTRFLQLHPFLDGNGRVARALLMQQCIDLFGMADMTLMSKGAEYYEALAKADSEDYASLAEIISHVVEE